MSGGEKVGSRVATSQGILEGQGKSENLKLIRESQGMSRNGRENLIESGNLR